MATAGNPGETLSVILGLVYNMEERLGLAKKVGVASVVVDVLLAHQKDELAIMSYQATMTVNSRDWFYAENALRIFMMSLATMLDLTWRVSVGTHIGVPV